MTGRPLTIQLPERPWSFDRMAGEVVTWHDREWPAEDGTPVDVERVAMKLTEEVGELAGALVKHLQGRTDEDWLMEAVKEFGDVGIVLSVIADRIAMLTAGRGDPMWPTFEGMVARRFYGGVDFPGVRDRVGASYREPDFVPPLVDA